MRAIGYVTPAAWDILEELGQRQNAFTQKAYAAGRLPPLNGLTKPQASFLKKIAEYNRYEGRGIPHLNAIYFPWWNWVPVTGAILVRYAPAKSNTRLGVASQLVILTDHPLERKQALAIRRVSGELPDIAPQTDPEPISESEPKGLAKSVIYLEPW